MDDFKQQLRRHYESQQLPPDRVQEILAAGREAAAEAANRAWWRMAAAAAVLLGLSIFGATAYFSKRPGAGEPPRLIAQSVASTVVGYFSNPQHELALVSTDRGMLVDWLKQHGGPADFEMPPAMARLTSFGCQVLEVQGRKVYIICLFLDDPSNPSTPGAMPDKKMMAAVGPDGQMMKKNRPLIHLVVAPKEVFAKAPEPGERIVLPATAEWNFSSWTQGDQIYVAAAALPAERLAALVSVL